MKNQLPGNPETNDPLDRFLSESDTYIPDNGFTSRVVAALPARRRHSWGRLGILSTATLIGACLIAWQLPAVDAIFAALPRQWSAFHWQPLLALLPLLAALVSLGWAFFAMVTEEE